MTDVPMHSGRPVYEQVAVEMILADLKQGHFPREKWSEHQIGAVGNAIYRDRERIEGVRQVLIRFGAIDPDDHHADIVAVLDMLLT